MSEGKEIGQKTNSNSCTVTRTFHTKGGYCYGQYDLPSRNGKAWAVTESCAFSKCLINALITKGARPHNPGGALSSNRLLAHNVSTD